MKHLFTTILSILFGMHVMAVNLPDSMPNAFDSIQAARDSVEASLRQQIQELQLGYVLMQEQLEITGQDAREDSLRQASLKARIDSLRHVTKGAPLVVDDDTLLYIYTRKGGILPEVRAENATNRILKAGKRITMFMDSVYLFEGEQQTDIMMGNDLLLSVTDMDALWANTDRHQLASDYRSIIEKKILELYNDYGLQQKLIGLALVVLIIFIQFILIKVTIRLFYKWRMRATRFLLKKMQPMMVKDYVLLNDRKMGMTALVIFNLLKYLIILMQLFVSVPLLFSLFPETKSFTYTIFGYILSPIRHILSAIIDYIPNVFQIIIIVVCFRYVIKMIRYFADEIAAERLKISGFYPDWAMPTFVILRILLYSFMFVMIWPLLPNSDSEVFQGVSVFIGLIVSLGSTSIVGNIMAGLVMTYMRPFRVGDYIRYNDTTGEVIERTILVTRIRTLKNEVVTIPNSNLMGSQIGNYTNSASRYGIIVHTKITIGYDEPWQKISSLLIEAAKKTEGIKTTPKPFVNVTALNDFYVEYEINAFTTRHTSLPIIYSNLHSHILDTMHGAGVEIMSPSIFATRPNLPTQIPPEENGKEMTK